MHTAVLGAGVNEVNRAINSKTLHKEQSRHNHFYIQRVRVGRCVKVGGISLCDIKQAGSRAQSGLGLDPLKLIAENERKVKHSFVMNSCVHEAQSNMEGG